MNVLDEYQLADISFDTNSQVNAGGGYAVKGHFGRVEVAVRTLTPLEIMMSEVLQMKPLLFFFIC